MSDRQQQNNLASVRCNKIRNILDGKLKYMVPSFQRDYSWLPEHLDQLWSDLMLVKETGNMHYFGQMVFRSSGSHNRIVIDGQQRLATLILLAVAARNLVIKQAAKVTMPDADLSAPGLTNYYLVKSPATEGIVGQRLTLNQRNKDHFDRLLTLSDCPVLEHVDQSNRRLNTAFRFFQARLKKFSGSNEAERFVYDVMDRLLVTVLTVNDEMAAYKLFESINMYGARLTNADLIKSHIFSVADKCGSHFLEYVRVSWAEIQQVGSDDVHTYIRDVLLLSEKVIRPNRLLEVVKRRINSAESLCHVLDVLRNNVDIYLALQDKNAAFWKLQHGLTERINGKLTALRATAGKSHLTLLMAACQKFQPAEFVDLLGMLEKMLVRSRIVHGDDWQRMHRIMNGLAWDIWNADKPFATVREKIRHLTASDTEFFAAFKEFSIGLENDAGFLRYLLYELEYSFTGKVVNDFPTIEHVLPSSPTDEWLTSFGGQHASWSTARLGNYALLSKSDNLKVGRHDFAFKRTVLCESGYTISRLIGERENWDLDNLNDHQTKLADQALKIW